MEKVKRIYNTAESIINLTGATVNRLDIQSFKCGCIEGYVGYLETADNITYRIRPDGTFEVVIK